ncbi:alpha/beta-hydrolase [Aspergillus candidus]|uniref:Alpha/beta-hydrolase n=1 Tax=Aspergillus candidus TaxID=41067 RepID=A0A2I2F2T9_ASPCN|nr:alpha/beta-hydrolase [Aspergillus candidus]PLB34954.1 alpha/beta-hydrolase [Aspergillus candidus]
MGAIRIALSFLILPLISSGVAASLPTVNLGYEVHQAISFNESQGLYNFSNIRYAAPPVGDLRFRAPEPPVSNRSAVQTGAEGRVCPQARPIWSTKIQMPFLQSLLSGQPFNQSTNISSYPYTPAPLDPRTTEDCLFLDVVVPKRVFDRGAGSAPVIVYFTGGGWSSGDKTDYNPTGLIGRSEGREGDGFVYVALNHRLGAFGFLGGENLEKDGTANAALHDQRMALRWVREHVAQFGGNPARITVMGESSAGNSIIHQITAYGGKQGPPDFQRAIVQSPAWYPEPSLTQNATLQQFLDNLNVSTVAEARRLPSQKLIAANAYQIATTPLYGGYPFAPVVDGSFVPAAPATLFDRGDFAHNLTIFSTTNAQDGLLFTNPIGATDAGFTPAIHQVIPLLPPSVLQYAANTLYPPIYNGSHEYTTPFQRTSVALDDMFMQCQNKHLSQTFRNSSYAYVFSAPPALHGQDLDYIFYNPQHPQMRLRGLPLNTTTAQALQDYVLSFVASGTPRSNLGPVIPRYGAAERVLDVGGSDLTIVRDPVDERRCQYWLEQPVFSGVGS